MPRPYTDFTVPPIFAPRISPRGDCFSHDRLRQGARAEPHRIGRREAGVGRGLRHGRPCAGLGHVERVETDPDHLGRTHRSRRPLVDLHQLGERRDPDPRLAAVVVADVVARSLMAQDERVRAAAVQQPEGDARVPRVNEAPLALDQHDVGVHGALEHELLGGAGHEIGHDRVDGDPPAFDEDPRLTGGHEPRPHAAPYQLIAQLELCRHLPDVAVRYDREDHIGVNFGGPAVGDRELGWRLAHVEDADALRAGQAPQLRVVGDERVEPAPDLEPPLERGLEPAAPLGRQLATHRRDADEHGAGPEREPARKIAHDRDRPTEAQHVPHGLARGDAVEHGDDALREVADAGVRGLRRERAELPVREDQEAVLVRGEHQADVLVLTGVTTGSRRSAPRRRSVVRSTAGSSDPTSPYQAPCTTWRTNTVVTARTGTATTSPATPMRVPMMSTLAMVSTGGSDTRCCMMRGTTTFASATCTATPSRMTATTLTQSPDSMTNRAGSSVDTSVPKKGTTATSPAKIPNASQKGTSSAHSPSAVSAARIIMARSWPTTQARKVAPASSSTRAPSGRYFGGSSDKTPSR